VYIIYIKQGDRDMKTYITYVVTGYRKDNGCPVCKNQIKTRKEAIEFAATIDNPKIKRVDLYN
jgi:hypothetical protein